MRKTEEFKLLAEELKGIPSVLRRRYQIDHLSVKV